MTELQAGMYRKPALQEFELLVTVTVADEPIYEDTDVERLGKAIEQYVAEITNDGVRVEAR